MDETEVKLREAAEEVFYLVSLSWAWSPKPPIDCSEEGRKNQAQEAANRYGLAREDGSVADEIIDKILKYVEEQEEWPG